MDIQHNGHTYKLDENSYSLELGFKEIPVSAALDTFENKRQILIYKNGEDTEDPIVHLRFDNNGNLVEILVLEDCEVITDPKESTWDDNRF